MAPDHPFEAVQKILVESAKRLDRMDAGTGLEVDAVERSLIALERSHTLVRRIGQRFPRAIVKRDDVIGAASDRCRPGKRP